MRPDRRKFLTRGAAAASTLLLGGCDRLSESPWFMDAIGSAENLTRHTQRLLMGNALAPEYSEAEISAVFKANGSTDPQDEDYLALAKDNFASWKLGVEGLVEKPAQFSLADLRAMPPRTQITRHDCVEGWSCIGKWTGVPLSEVLNRAGVKPQAKYVVFYAADDVDADEVEEEDDDEETENSAQSRIAGSGNIGQKSEREDIGSTYYETIELRDTYHAQTILAYDMNGKTLTVPHGAPLRLRLERMLGYKMAKYLMRIELVESFADIGKGKGGYWEDRGYDWYAGI
jgi:DMSO/TMAO reductase YedYZ molybdopterin-dependent catalytic subunit